MARYKKESPDKELLVDEHPERNKRKHKIPEVNRVVNNLRLTSEADEEYDHLKEGSSAKIERKTPIKSTVNDLDDKNNKALK